MLEQANEMETIATAKIAKLLEEESTAATNFDLRLIS
jgi:hypothetical protein